MKPISRKLAPMAALAVVSLALETAPAQAQPNTYADFPFQQGSLFYQYNPQNRPKPRRQVARPAYTTPAQPGTSYYRQPTQGTYYAQPQPGTYYTQPRRGLFGRILGR